MKKKKEAILTKDSWHESWFDLYDYWKVVRYAVVLKGFWGFLFISFLRGVLWRLVIISLFYLSSILIFINADLYQVELGGEDLIYSAILFAVPFIPFILYALLRGVGETAERITDESIMWPSYYYHLDICP